MGDVRIKLTCKMVEEEEGGGGRDIFVWEMFESSCWTIGKAGSCSFVLLWGLTKKRCIFLFFIL